MTTATALTNRRPTPAQQVLVGAAATLSWQPRGADGEPSTPDGTVTVGVTTAAGEVVVAAGAATAGTSSDPRTYALAARSEVDLLVATWAVDDDDVATTLIEIVGGYWFSLSDVRTRDPLMNATSYPDARILAVRAEVEAFLEEATHTAWVPRYRLVQVPGAGDLTFSDRAYGWSDGMRALVVPDTAIRLVRSVREYSPDGVTYSDFTTDDLAGLRIDDGGVLVRPNSRWLGGYSYLIGYEHGYDAPPKDFRDEAITLLRYRLNSHRTGTDPRTTSMTSGAASYALSTTGPTGLPSVDAAIERYKFHDFGIA